MGCRDKGIHVETQETPLCAGFLIIVVADGDIQSHSSRVKCLHEHTLANPAA